MEKKTKMKREIFHRKFLEIVISSSRKPKRNFSKIGGRFF